MQVVKHNIDRQNQRIAGFEIGRIHFRDGDKFQEQPVVGIILSGPSALYHWDEKTGAFDFFDLKGIVENLLEVLGISNAVYKNIGLKTFHSGRQASVFIDALEIGSIGEIHPAIQRRLDVSQRVIFGEFNLQDLQQLTKPLEKVKPSVIFPGSERDWTITIREDVPFDSLIEMVKKQKSTLLESVDLKFIYRSEKLPTGFQNVTLHFVYRDPTKTVEQEFVEAEHQKLTRAVLAQLGGSIVP